MNLYKYLEESLPQDHSNQVNSSQIINPYLTQGFSPLKMLDFGSRNEGLLDFFMKNLPDTKITSVNIGLTGIKTHQETNTKIHAYDGKKLPFKDNSFDFIYSHQALEHVLHPKNALSEIARVLNTEGFFIGQTSQFEPLSSLNLWNFTLFGFKRMIEKAGMRLVELRPSIDGLTLMERAYSGDLPKYNRYFNIESPINTEIENSSSQKQLSNRMINYKKLLICGQFCFICSLRPQHNSDDE